MLMWTDHYFQNLLDDKTLRAALMELEMSEYVSKDFDFEEFLPCYPCLHVLPEEIFYTLPSYSEYPTMSWGQPCHGVVPAQRIEHAESAIESLVAG
jgi:hypothetical protein